MKLTPRMLGFRMPAEWEPHAGTWLSWPHNRNSWPGRFDPIPLVFEEIVAVLAQGEAVHINVSDPAMEQDVQTRLLRRGLPPERLHLHRIPTNDAWCRDHGPIFLKRGNGDETELAAVDWGYNAWGGKYPPYDLDNAVPAQVAEHLGLRCFRPEMILEGGSIDVNGAGALLTTESCLLNPNRNPHLTRPEIEARLRDFLGVEQILWLGEGIAGDDTDGHIDDLARFVDTQTVVTAVEHDPSDVNFAPLRDNLRRLQTMRDLAGRSFNVISLPMPPAAWIEEQRTPRSYANFYIANDAVLLPTYRAPSDAVAVEVLQRVFPGRKVVGIDCSDLVWGLGAIHCVTQQLPKLGTVTNVPN